MWISAGTTLLALSAAVLLSACGDKGAAAAAPGGGMPPPSVGVVTATAGAAALSTELPGRLEPWRVAQVRARVSGVVLKRLFTEGSDVKAGQSLFQVDAAPYRATLESAQAAQGKAEANLAQAQANLQRNEPLAAAKAISQQEWVATQTALKQAQADVASAKAAVQTARLNVDYAAVISPISGRIGRSQVTEGALVGQGEATLLATVQQIDPLYVNFTQSASEAMHLRQSIEQGALKRTGDASKVTVVLEDGSEYPLPGKLLFTDLTVDATSGQVTLRAELPNPKGLLLPGLYVKVRLQQAQAASAILLPQQAVTRGASGDTVLVVGPDHQVNPRPVKVSAGLDHQWVVSDGLKVGEQVVVDGFQHISPKTPVTPVPWTPTGAAPAASAAAAASR
jgi:membrane fusion protein (multidrug efflux system)